MGMTPETERASEEHSQEWLSREPEALEVVKEKPGRK
jgi:hypothetical protein